MLYAGESPPSWLIDLTLCEKYHWTWDEVQATPQWVVERAVLWQEVVTAWRQSQNGS